MSSEFVLRMFGALRLEAGTESISKFPTKRSALLLARVAVARDGSLGRDELAELLWPDDYLDVTRLRLRQELRRLRQAVGPFGDYIRADRQWIEIEAGVLRTDAGQLDEAAIAGLAAEDPLERVRHLQRAIDLYGGPFLAGFQEPWVLSVRRDYEDKIRKIWLELADALQLTGDEEAAIRANVSVVRLFPLDLETNAGLIRRLVGKGRIAQARQAFLDLDASMTRELGYHAPSSLMSLIKETADSSELTPPFQPEIVKPQIARPLPIYGRAELLHAVAASIGRQGALVALVGPVGVGKSHLLQESLWQLTHHHRLAVQLGGAPGPVEDGVYVPDPKLESEALHEIIREAAGNGWRVLAESRVRLDMDGVVEILVVPLPVPHLSDSAEAVLNNPSVRILTSRIAEHGGFAAGEQNAFQLRDLARSLDGMPAALVVFGSRLVVQTPEQVNKTLEDGLHEYAAELLEPLRMAIYGLPEEAKEALHSLAVLAGASADLAAALVGPHDSAEVYRLLERRCLIAIQDDGLRLRYRIPKPLAFAVREMMSTSAQLRLVAKTWEDVAQWVFDKSRKLWGPDQEAAFTSVQSELRNLLAGILWATQHDPKLAAFMVVGTWRTVCARGNPALEAPLLLRALEAGVDQLDPVLGGEAWVGTATALAIAGLLDDSEKAYLAALDVYEREGDSEGIAWAQMNWATMVIRLRDPRRATEMCRVAANLTSKWGVKVISRCYYSLGLAEIGEIEEAIRVGEEVFAERLQSNDVTEEARSYGDLALLYCKIGRIEAARPLLLEGIQRLRRAGIQDMHFEALMSLVSISSDLDEIQEHLAEASGLARKIGSIPMRQEVAVAQAGLASQRGDMPGTIAALEEVFRFAKALESPLALETSLRTLGIELERQSRLEYANAVRSVLGEEFTGPIHTGWKSLLSSDSRATVCVLAVVMAKEALLSGS